MNDAASPPDRVSSTRRRLLKLAMLAPPAAALSALPGCSQPEQVDGTFLQPWLEHLSWTASDWQRSMKLARRAGCRQLVLQWAGILGGEEGDWQLSDTSLALLFKAADGAGIDVRVGLPFEHAWWQAIGGDDAQLRAFFSGSLQRARDWLQQSRLPLRNRFAGWYLPYELEQYHWTSPARLQWLRDWLHGLQEAAQQRGGDCAISTYYSRLPGNGKLTALWAYLLEELELRPMVQDGVGAAGEANLHALEPLLALFRQRGIGFDVIVELFHQHPDTIGDGSDFKAESADFNRVKRQLQWARDSGADNILAYALEPWLTQGSPEARALRRRWNL